MADPVLSAVLSGQRAIALSWTYGSNADFQVFWKSSSPPGQEYVLLATTNAFTYTTPDLNPSMTYDFYVRANVGATYFYSNVVELFVSCGKGVILEPDPPPSPDPQLVPRNIYLGSGGSYKNILMQTEESGNFNPISGTVSTYGWMALCCAYNGDVYAAEEIGDIWKQTGGVGSFSPLGVSSTIRWYAMAASPNGDIYATGNSQMYILAGGIGSFTLISQTSRFWFGMCSDHNGNIYAGVNQGYIYMRTGGTGAFNLVYALQKAWRGFCAKKNGDIYACVYDPSSADIYKQTGGVGDFVALGQSGSDFYGMCATPKEVYLNKNNVGVLKMNRATGIFEDIGSNGHIVPNYCIASRQT